MIVSESRKLPGWTWRKVLNAIGEVDLTSALPRIVAPTLLICGDEDALFGRSSQQALLRGLPDASLAVIPGVGHSPHWEEPHAVAHLITSFAARSMALAEPLESQG